MEQLRPIEPANAAKTCLRSIAARAKKVAGRARDSVSIGPRPSVTLQASRYVDNLIGICAASCSGCYLIIACSMCKKGSCRARMGMRGPRARE